MVPADLVFGANDDPTAGSQAADGAPDTFRMVRSGADIQLYVNGSRVFAGPVAATRVITINGSGDTDTLIVDHGHGNPVPVGGITFNGGGETGAPGDALQILGGSFSKVIYTYATDTPDGGPFTAVGHNGSVNLDGSIITYSGLEPITNSGTAADAVFNLPDDGLDNLATLEDTAVPNNGMSQLRSGNASFETTAFTNPTGLLTINASNDGETIIAGPLDSLISTPFINLNGNTGNDGFSITPSAQSAFIIDGNAPMPPGSGDRLTVSTAGTTNPFLTVLSPPSGLTGNFTFGNRQPVNFQEIESLGTNGVDLTITNTDGVTAAIPGTTVTYTITVSNVGPLGINGVSVVDLFPAALSGVTYTSNSSGGATGNTPVGTGNITDTVRMPVGSSITYTATGTVGPGGPGMMTLSNTATVTPPAGAVDLTPADNAATDTDVIASVDLTVTKTSTVAAAIPGSQVTYTITVTNFGMLPVTGAAVVDLFPAALSGVTYTSNSSGGATGNTAVGTGDINDTVHLPVGSSLLYTATGTIDPGATGTLSNTATVTPPAGIPDANPADNAATDTDLLAPAADLQVTVTDTPDPVTAGTNLTYTIAVANAGPSVAQGVSLSDAIPADTTFVSFTAPAGFTTTTPAVGGTGTVTATGPTLALNSAVFTLVVKVNASAANGGTISNTASVGTTVADPNPANNTVTETTTVTAAADLSVTQSDAADLVLPGGNITYTITVANAGPSDAQGVSLSDVVPTNTTFVSFEAPAGFITTTPPAGGTGTVSAAGAPLPAGASATFTLVVSVDPAVTPGTTITNAATVGAATADPVPANNTDTETATIATPVSLSVTTTDGQTAAVPGTPITFTITVSNVGSNPVTGVALTDAFPGDLTGVTFTSTATGGATGNTATGAGDINDTLALPPGSGVSYTVTGTVSPSATGFLSHTATVTPPAGSFDVTPADNSATDTDTLTPQADLSVAVADSPNPATAGTSLTYTIVLSNAGPSAAQGVSLTDVIPANTTFVAATQTSGPAFALTTPDAGGTGTLTVTGSLASGAFATFILVVGVNADAGGSTLANTATASATTPDPDTANNSVTATATVGTPPPVGRSLVVSGTSDGAARLFDTSLQPVGNPIAPFPGFAGEVRVASGDFDADGVLDAVLVTGPGIKTAMAVVSGRDGSILVAPADPFGDANFVFGGFVTAGDIDGDGRSEWVVTPELRGGPRVIIFRLNPSDPRGFDVVGNFFGIQDDTFRDGARAALGDVNGDGILDVFAIAAFNGGPRTALFNGADVLVAGGQNRAPAKLTGDFFAAPSGADEGRGGRSITVGDVTGDGVADFIATGDNQLGTGNQVVIFSGEDLIAGRFPGFGATPLANFAVGGQSPGALISVAAVNTDGDARADLGVGSGAGQASLVKVYLGTNLSGVTEPASTSLDPFGATTVNGVFVG